MKKIIALAVASAFVAPVMAAEVTVSGLVEYAFQDANGTTATGFGDNAIYISAATETANGLSVSADINLTGAGGDDGSDSITVKGPFGTLDLGDTSSAVDKYDDRTDKDVMIGGVGTTGVDAGASWTLPTFVNGLSTYVSYSADANDDGDDVAHTGFALQYTTGPVQVAYADLQADADADNATYIGGTVTMSGFAVSVERMETGASGAETSEQGVGVTYSMGDVTFAVSQIESEDANNAVTSDITFYGVKYALGGGVTLFAETSSDDIDASAEESAVGVAIAF